MADPVTQQLKEALRATMSPERATRTAAEGALQGVEAQPGFTLTLLGLIEAALAPDATPEDKAVQQAAAIYFKNTVKRRWKPEEGSAIPDTDKTAIKAAMVNYMCTMPPNVQRMISEALSIISKHDFPAKWTELLPELVSKFTLDDFHVTNGVLATANSIMKRFRWVSKTDALMKELVYCLEQLQAPLLALFKATAERVLAISSHPGAAGNPDAYRQLLPMMSALRTMARIFFSLNWQDLPEYFEDHMAEWMEVFLKFLSYSNPTLSDPDDETEPGPIEKLQAAIVENVNLYAEKYEEEFAPHLPGFAQAVWALLMRCGPHNKFDALASTAIRFLTSIVSKQHYSSLFAGHLSDIVTQIVVPNLMLRESDEELFEDNPAEWIQKDMEGNDMDTRRRCACDLVKGMAKQFEAETTQLCGAQITTLLAAYDASPATEWRKKDAAVQLLVAVSVRASTAASGVSQLNEAIPLQEMMARHILPELNAASGVNDKPLLRADCLKFVNTFRNQLPAATLADLLPTAGAHVLSESQVVASYAASFLERALTVKDRTPGAPSATLRVGRAQLQPHLQGLFGQLFTILGKTDESFENEYVMKAIMRCLSVTREDVVPLAPQLIGYFNTALDRVCRNPRNPLFNHYLFESTAVLVGSACSANPALTEQFESLLFPPFQHVLAQDVAEFTPYVFQILAQLLEYRPSQTLSDSYRALLPPLLAPAVWDRRGNVPALVRLLSAYLSKGVAEIVPAGQLQPMLGIFQKLLSSKATEGEAFALLDSLVAKAGPHLSAFLPTVFGLLMQKLQKAPSLRFNKLLVRTLCLMAAKLGPAAVVEQGLEQVQAGLFAMVVTSVWAKATETPPPNASDAKVLACGTIRLLCESPAVQANAACWTQLLSGLVGAMEPSTSGSAVGGQTPVDEDAEEGDVAVAGFDAEGMNKLHFTKAGATEDLLPEIPDVPAAACRALGGLCTSSPGVYLTRVQQLPPAQASALAAHCQRVGVQLV